MLPWAIGEPVDGSSIFPYSAPVAPKFGDSVKLPKSKHSTAVPVVAGVKDFLLVTGILLNNMLLI